MIKKRGQKIGRFKSVLKQSKNSPFFTMLHRTHLPALPIFRKIMIYHGLLFNVGHINRCAYSVRVGPQKNSVFCFDSVKIGNNIMSVSDFCPYECKCLTLIYVHPFFQGKFSLRSGSMRAAQLFLIVFCQTDHYHTILTYLYVVHYIGRGQRSGKIRSLILSNA